MEYWFLSIMLLIYFSSWLFLEVIWSILLEIIACFCDCKSNKNLLFCNTIIQKIEVFVKIVFKDKQTAW